MKRRRMTQRSPVSRRVESLLELPEGLLGHCTRMEWTDNRRVLVEGCCEILEYEDDRVQVAVAGGSVRFWGQRLQLNCLTADSILLTGQIQSVEFLLGGTTVEWMRVWRWARGWVRFEAEGGAPGRLLTLAARERLPIWDTHREGVMLTAGCFAADYRRLRPLARRCGLRLHLKERHGAAFVMRRYHARPGLLAGVAVYALLLIFLSGRIWSLDIRGLDTADEAALRGLLQEHGVAVGRPKARVDSEAVRLDALTRLTDISWLAVNLDGCVAEIEVREMNPDEAPPQSAAPSNLVAARDGIVLSVEVTGGAATVQVGDAVAEGGMLASGIIVTERETLFRRSSGRVMAETAREIILRVPLTETLLLPTGHATETLELHLFGLTLPLFDNSISGTDCRLEEHQQLLTINGVPLPLGVRMRRYTPLAEQQVTRTVTEAKALANELLTKEEEAQLKDVEVLERTVTVEEVGGVLVLCAAYRCVEDIAREIPIQMASSP